jgi:shikimate 5-dehydrogenase
MRSIDFGGASITIPHKETVLNHLDSCSEAASVIGAVNTVLVQGEELSLFKKTRKLHGENTDWIGIYKPIERALVEVNNKVRWWTSPSSPSVRRRPVSLIYGAGGTCRAACYAMAVKLKFDVLIVNRTPCKGKEVASDLTDKFRQSKHQTMCVCCDVFRERECVYVCYISVVSLSLRHCLGSRCAVCSSYMNVLYDYNNFHSRQQLKEVAP